VSGPDLGRRWLASLLVVPADEREAVVRAVERRVAEVFGPHAHADDEILLDVAEAPVQRDGYVEQVIRTYARPEENRDQEANGRGKHRSAS